MGFQQNLLEKAYFVAKMSGPAGQFWLLKSALRQIKRFAKYLIKL